jgi:hypothetical protein
MSTLKTRVGTLLRKLPVAERYLNARWLRRRFPVELGLIEGRHVSPSTSPSVIHFSLDKAATQYTKRILRRCAVDTGLVPVGLHDYAWNSDLPYFHQMSPAEMQRYRHVFKPRGYVYTLFNGMFEGIPDLDQYRVFLMVRDPRDILVSDFYSMAYSHPAPQRTSGKYAHFMQIRELVRRSTVDEFVLHEAGEVRRVLERYKTLLVDAYPSVYVTSYEEMTEDFDGWLTRLLSACGLAISADLRRTLDEEHARLTPKDENVHRHIRKGRPGDFEAKLEPETIEQLNTKLGPMLEAFGYAADGARGGR